MKFSPPRRNTMEIYILPKTIFANYSWHSDGSLFLPLGGTCVFFLLKETKKVFFMGEGNTKCCFFATFFSFLGERGRHCCFFWGKFLLHVTVEKKGGQAAPSFLSHQGKFGKIYVDVHTRKMEGPVLQRWEKLPHLLCCFVQLFRTFFFKNSDFVGTHLENCVAFFQH